MYPVYLALALTGVPAQRADAGFPDVPKSHWAYAAVTELKAKGILLGYPPEPPGGAASPKSRPAARHAVRRARQMRRGRRLRR
ncbi:MAG TPA: S-layer homology domain-containing protein [Chthonomonadaceae bacterium]|nr:S-layer homology domain-containing protein [Chthonomonadaceae bacterium]